MASRDITLQLRADADQLRSELNRAERGFDSFESNATDATSTVSSSFDRLGGVVTFALGDLAARAASALGEQLTRLAGDALETATAIEETANKFTTVFGPATQEVNGFIAENARLMGLTNQEAQDLIARTGQIVQGLGFSAEASADFSTEISKVAGDLASFNNMPTKEVLDAINSGLTGEREQLKQLGIVIQETDVQQKALNQTGKQSADALTDQEEATATLELITEKAGVAIGDLARTEDSAANKKRRLEAETRQLYNTLTSQLLPAFTSGIETAGGFVETLNDWVGMDMSEQIQDEKNQLNSLVSEYKAANTSSERRSEIMATLQEQYPEFLKSIDIETASQNQLTQAINEANDAYDKRIAQAAEQEKLTQIQERLTEHQRTRSQLQQQFYEQLIELEQESGVQIETTGKSIEEIFKQVRRLSRESDDLNLGPNIAGGLANTYDLMDRKSRQVTHSQESLNEQIGLTVQALQRQEVPQQKINDLVSDYIRDIEDFPTIQKSLRNELRNTLSSSEELTESERERARELTKILGLQDKLLPQQAERIGLNEEQNRKNEQSKTITEQLRDAQEKYTDALRDFDGTQKDIKRVEQLKEELTALRDLKKEQDRLNNVRRFTRQREQGTQMQSPKTEQVQGERFDTGLGTQQLDIEKVEQVGQGYKSATEMALDFDNATREASTAQQLLQSTSQRFVDSFGQGMANVIVQGKSLMDMLQNIGKLLLSSAIQTGIQLLLSGGGSGITGGLFGALGIGGARAEGGPVTGGRRYLVGEQGPELFEAPSNGRIVNNSETEAALQQHGKQSVNGVEQGVDYNRMAGAFRAAMNDFQLETENRVSGDQLIQVQKMTRKRKVNSGQKDPAEL